MSTNLSLVRNIGIAAHIDAGKTTTTERILFYTGRTHRMGEVDDGTTTTDFDEEEQKRGITIYSAAVTCPWREYTIHLIDTPGHVDFTAEVERSLRVLDGMVAVFDAREGVEPQSETVWRQADKYGVPRICFINKMDRIGADFERAVASLRERLHARPIVLQFPIGSASELCGVVDVIGNQALYFTDDSLGATIEVRPIPTELESTAEGYRHQLMDALTEHCDALMEKCIADAPVSVADIHKAIRECTIRRVLQPVLCGSALKHVGVQPLLDAICAFLPSPLDIPPAVGTDPKKTDREISLKASPDEPLAALVFKVVAEKPVDLHYLRIYSGTLKSNSRLLNPATGEKENISRMYRMFAKRRDQVDTAVAGDIVAVIGPRDTLTGHTLCDPRRPVLLEPIEFPATVISVSVEPRSSKDRDKLAEALRALERQDPTIRVATNAETGQTLISGMGELHLEIQVQRLRNDMNVDVAVGRPRVSYREAVTTAGDGEGRFERQIGGRMHFASVRLRIEPREHKTAGDPYEVVDRLPAETLPQEYVDAVRAGLVDASSSGVLGGYPVIDWRVTIVDGEHRDADSSELAFEAAGRLGFYEAMKAAHPALLEPIMDVQVMTPDEYFGAILGDLNARNAEVRDTSARGTERTIHAYVPLAQMFGYVTKLRSLSQGRASSTMAPSHYAAVSAEAMKAMVG